MSNPIGLERLPADLSASLAACASALSGCASQLDQVLARADTPALEQLGQLRGDCGVAVSELLAAVRWSRRAGPDRPRLAELARSADRTAEAIESAAWAWTRHPIPELADVLRALRDATRAAARAVDALEDEEHRMVWGARCRERVAEANFLARAARGALLARQDDVHLAAAAYDLLTYAELWVAAVSRLRAAVLRCSLA